MPLNLFGPNVAKLKRDNDVEGLLRVIRRDKSGAAEIQLKKDAVDALCTMGGPTVQAILDLYADGQVDPVVRDYLSLHAKEFSAFEQSPELLTRHVDGLVQLVRRDESWDEKSQTKRDAVDALCSMGDPAVPAILDLLDLEGVASYLRFRSEACKGRLESPKVAAAIEQAYQRDWMLGSLQPPVYSLRDKELRRMTRSQLAWIATHLGVATDPQMTRAQLADVILAGRVQVELPTARADRVQAPDLVCRLVGSAPNTWTLTGHNLERPSRDAHAGLAYPSGVSQVYLTQTSEHEGPSSDCAECDRLVNDYLDAQRRRRSPF